MHNKIIRDKISEIINYYNRKLVTKILNIEEYLNKKIKRAVSEYF